MRTKRRVSLILNDAADLIENDGWATGPHGWWPGGSCSGYCIEGAILKAIGYDPTEDNLIEVARTAPYKAVQEFLGWADSPLYRWNDTKAHDAEEVVAVLRATAFIARARETAATEARKRRSRERVAA